MVQINFQISEEKKKKFDVALAKSGDSKTQVLNDAIDKYLEEKGD